MASCKNATASATLRGMTQRASAGPPRGVLHVDVPEGRREHRRVRPCEALSPYVAHFWSVRWSLPQPVVVETLPHPTVHVVFEWGRSTEPRAEVAGVPRGRFTRELAGEAQVFGVKFRPGMFRPLHGRAVAELTGRVLPTGAVFGAAADAWSEAVMGAPDLDAAITASEGFLTPRLPPVAPELAALRDLVERMETERSLVRAEDAALRLGVDLRTLQRRFRDAVGVSPKWVIGRYRLHEAAERLRGPDAPTLAVLAAELGYFDQAHFARAFKAAVGQAPRRFAAGR